RGGVLAGLVILALLAFAGGSAIADPDVAPGLGGNEPDTAVVNPLNPQNVAIARGGTLRLSTDFGRTFPTSVGIQFPAGLVGYGGCGDSSLAFDSQGRLFWNYLVCVGNPITDISVVVMQVNPITGVTGTPIDLT